MDEFNSEYTPAALAAAQAYWARSLQPPLDLVVELMELGYDVEALEREYA